MTLKVLDISRFQGPTPDLGDYDAVIVNCTPQNTNRDSQIQEVLDSGKLIGYYNWPWAFANDWYQDGVACAEYVNSWISRDSRARGPVFNDFETGSFTGDPVIPSLDTVKALHEAGLSAHDYIQYSLINEFNWQPHVDAGCALWFAEYTSVPDQTYGAWPFATGWQDSDKPDGSTNTGGDDSVFYLDADAWNKLSYPPDSKPPAPAQPQPAPVVEPVAQPTLPPPPAPAPVNPPPGAPSQCVVESGDTLSSIADQFGVTVNGILAANPWIGDPNYIQVGWVLNLPSGNPSTSGIVYIVEQGDTLSGIAGKYGTDYQTLANYNGISDPNVIYPGQEIRIP